MRTPLLCLFLLAAVLPAHARMYQWVDPQSGTTQLSGKPPAWYRSETGGPRIFVFEAGVLVDDTARVVPADRREGLRSAAFQAAMDAEDLAEAARLRETLDAGQPSAPDDGKSLADDVAALAAALGEPEAGKAPAKPVEEPAAESTVARLKAIIENWDRQQTERARQVLESDDLAPSP